MRVLTSVQTDVVSGANSFVLKPFTNSGGSNFGPSSSGGLISIGASSGQTIEIIGSRPIENEVNGALASVSGLAVRGAAVALLEGVAIGFGGAAAVSAAAPVIAVVAVAAAGFTIFKVAKELNNSPVSTRVNYFR